MGCGSCGPQSHSGAPTCCGKPMKEKGDKYVCSVSSSHSTPKSRGC